MGRMGSRSPAIASILFACALCAMPGAAAPKASHVTPASISASPRLIRAIMLEDWATAATLAKDKAEVATRRKDGSTPLSLAAERGNEALVLALLDTKAYDAVDSEFALARAGLKHQTRVVDLLIAKGVTVGAASYPLIVQSLDPVAIGLFLRAPAKSWKVSFGKGSDLGPILPWAVASGDEALVKSLLKLGADPESISDEIICFHTSALWIAAAYGRADLVQDLLEAKATISTVADQWGKLTPLMAAAISGDVETAKLLVKAGAALEPVSGWMYFIDKGFAATGRKFTWNKNLFGGRTALMFAAEHGRLDMVRYLVSAGAKIDTVNEKNHSALTMAMWNGQDEIDDCLRSLGAKATKTDMDYSRGELLLIGITSLMPSIIDNYIGDLEALYGASASFKPLATAVSMVRRIEKLDLADKSREGKLFIALSILDIFIKKASIIPEEDRMEALQQAETDRWLLAVLIDGGIRVKSEDMLRFAYPFAMAGDEAHYKVCLEAYGKPLKAQNLELAMNFAAIGGSRSILDSLLAMGAKLDDDKSLLARTYQSTPLGFAAGAGNIASMEYLIAKGANITPAIRDRNQGCYGRYSPLMMACEGGQMKAFRYLLGKGAEVDQVNYDKETALSMMAREGKQDFLVALLDAGANPNFRMMKYTDDPTELLSKVPCGETALMRAAQAGQLECVRILLARGADPRLTDWNGDDALVWARLAGKAEVEALLRKTLGDLYH